MKRLTQLAGDGRLDASAWALHEKRWRGLGLRPGEILQVRSRLIASAHARAVHEEELQDGIEARRPRDAALTADERRARRRRRKILQAALEILETERDRHGRLLWRGGFARVAQALRVMLGLGPPAPARRGRGKPGEDWVKPLVAELATLFAPRCLSTARTADEVYRALSIAGHGDVVGPDTVRHVLRAQTRARVQGRGGPG